MNRSKNSLFIIVILVLLIYTSFTFYQMQAYKKSFYRDYFTFVRKIYFDLEQDLNEKEISNEEFKAILNKYSYINDYHKQVRNFVKIDRNFESYYLNDFFYLLYDTSLITQTKVMSEEQIVSFQEFIRQSNEEISKNQDFLIVLENEGLLSGASKKNIKSLFLRLNQLAVEESQKFFN